MAGGRGGARLPLLGASLDEDLRPIPLTRDTVVKPGTGAEQAIISILVRATFIRTANIHPCNEGRERPTRGACLHNHLISPGDGPVPDPRRRPSRTDVSIVVVPIASVCAERQPLAAQRQEQQSTSRPISFRTLRLAAPYINLLPTASATWISHRHNRSLLLPCQE